MTISCSFFDHVKYPASEFLNRDKDFINNGVLHPTDFALTSPTTPNMTMNEAVGVAWVNGYRIGYDATPVQTLTFAAANATNPRIDLVEVGYTGTGSTGTGVIKVVTGTPAVSPLQPQPDAGFIPLFAVAVAANATALTVANVTDLRVSVSLTGTTNTPLSSVVPAVISPNSTGNTGTGTKAAREDHGHPAPPSYPPSEHAAAHATGGADPIPVATEAVDGLLAHTDKTKLDGIATGATKVTQPSDIGAATSAQGAEADSTATNFTAHLADLAPHGATALATANKIALRDANGNVVANLPITGQNPNLLFNPSFNLGTAGWTGVGSNGFSVVFGWNAEGSFLKNVGTSTVSTIGQHIPISAGQAVTISSEMYANGVTFVGSNANTRLEFYNASNTFLSKIELDVTANTPWTKLSGSAIAPAGCSYAMVACGVYNGGSITQTGYMGWRKIKVEIGSITTMYSDDNTLNTLQYGSVLPLAQILSGGNKKQTGSTSATVVTAGVDVGVTVTFPVAFATSPVITVGLCGVTVGGAGYVNARASTVSATSVIFSVNSYVAQAITFNWEATGS